MACRIHKIHDSQVDEIIASNMLDRFFVYFVEAEGTNLVKIGESISNPEWRMAQLQTGSPVKLELAGYAVVFTTKLDRLALKKTAARVERFVHRRFDEVRQHGEWFDQRDLVFNMAMEDDFWCGALEEALDSGRFSGLGCNSFAFAFVNRKAGELR